MISLAQRVRDFRYAKGWGPDELANRAEISRTALYQIESGKTGQPRAGTLRRIAVALDVSMEELLGHMDAAMQGHHTALTQGRSTFETSSVSSRSRGLGDWIPSEGGPLTLPGQSPYTAYAQPAIREEVVRTEEPRPRAAVASDSIYMREGELLTKLHELLHSPLGPGIARIIDDLHQMLPRVRALS